jgi:hypothetical protein
LTPTASPYFSLNISANPPIKIKGCRNPAKNQKQGGSMDMVSMALGGAPRVSDPVSRVVMDSGAQMNDLAQKMLKVGLEVAVKGLEMGKGEHIDVVG